MKKILRCGIILLFFLHSFPGLLHAQHDRDSFAVWLHEYKQDFLSDARAPLRASDTGNIRFYPFNPKLLFPHASLRLLHRRELMSIATHSGKTKRARAYAEVYCQNRSGLRRFLPRFLLDSGFRLTLYQILPAGSDSARDDLLFLPFYDATNGITTYGGGRYIDLQLADIHEGHIRVDFNRAYNPWCAYKEGYNCPFPPEENHLNRALEAGEKMFAGKVQE